MATIDYTDDEDVADQPTYSELDWNWQSWPSHMRKAIVIFFTVILALVAAYFLAQWALKDLNRKLKTELSLNRAAQDKLTNAAQERKDIETNLPLLRELESAGIFGQEKRLEWVEQLRSIEKRWPGIQIKYDISAQELLQSNQPSPEVNPAIGSGQPPTGKPEPKLELYSSNMRLSLSLVHEGDALAIIEELKNAQLGHFSVQSCSFKRQPPDTAANNSASASRRAVEAECLLSWISMRTNAPN
jgi:hypothetical protein